MTSLTPRRFLVVIAACAVLLALLLLISPGVGTESASFGWRDAWRAQLGLNINRTELVGRPFVDLDQNGAVSDEELAGFVRTAKHIGFNQRFPRSLLALQVGMTLALCGAVFQILFRNDLATPYTLGIASGGSLGTLAALRFGWTFALPGFSAVTLAAFAGGLLVVAAVYMLARGARRMTSNEMLLAGVTIGLFSYSMMMLLTFVSREREVFEMIRWMMGSLDPISERQTTTMLPLLMFLWLVLIAQGRALNQYRLGEELAEARGVHVARLQGLCVICCTLAVSAVVAHCGPIGFVGLVVPHIVVLLFGSDCRMLLPASAMLGGAFLIICDWASQVTMRFAGWVLDRQLAGATLPIGVVTAIIGVPLFLGLLRMRRT